jgi:biopolymer transport protein ExbD
MASKLKKHSRGRGEDDGLSINSMMDIMVIILVFLLKSYSTESITVAASADLTLPVSSASKSPETAVSVVVSQSQLTVDGEFVVKMEKVPDEDNPGQTITQFPEEEKKGQLVTVLHDVLLEKAKQAQAMGELTGSDELGFKGRLLLQCDKGLPFEVVRQVMYTAGQAQFGEFRFVVYQQEG